ncbi:MAG: hypothetical protein H6711_16935 [Myxococcales bacterium]|nr:hypothetical protein [Myxococcales bacterium]
MRVWLFLALAALAGTTAGCLASFAPPIRPVDHHAGIEADAGRQSCLACHDLESTMAARMRGMTGDALAAHLEAMASEPPLVQDWMVEDRRSCVDCHRVRAPHGRRAGGEGER